MFGFRLWACTGPVGGSWVVISGIIRRITLAITHTQGLFTLLTTTTNP